MLCRIILVSAFSFIFVSGQSNLGRGACGRPMSSSGSLTSDNDDDDELFKNKIAVSTVGSAKVLHHEEYLTNLFNEAILDVEQHGWSNLKCDDISQKIDEQIYNWKLTGTVNYTNGFIVSIQRIDLNDMSYGAGISNAYVRGDLNFRDTKVGFDVLVDLGDETVHKYTGTFIYTDISWTVAVMKNFDTNKITVSVDGASVSGASYKMMYLPADHITQVISRNYKPKDVYDSVDQWAIDIIEPAMLKAANRIGFPSVCLSC